MADGDVEARGPSWRHEGAGRTVVFGPGLAGGLADVLAGEGWTSWELLSTERALASAPGLADAAARTHLVPQGPVPEAAAALIDEVGADRLVALGGGRVIDTAKAIAAVRGGAVAAVPTTLSGAEMTAIHRLPAGRTAASGVRPALVLADPDLMASAPEPQLRASAMNALAHGADSLYTPLASERSRKEALRGAALIATALDAPGSQRDRADLALGSLMCASALAEAGLALHHVLSQTLVRVCGTPHAETNAAVLPVVMDAMRERAPERIAELAEALGTGPEGIGARIEQLGGGRRGLSELGASRECIEPALDTATARGELETMTPGDVTREDVRALIEAAW